MLARRLGRPFLDFDVELARREGQSVAEIFAERGEAYFRALEASLSAELVEAPADGARARRRVDGQTRAGGGTFAGTGAYHLPPRRSGDRAAADGPGVLRRPLLRGPDPLEALRRLFVERDALYRAADHVFDTERFYQQQLTSVIASLADRFRGGVGYAMDEHLTLLLADLRERFGAGTDRRELEAYLSSKGYDVRQIGEILAHLQRDISSTALPTRRPASPSACRAPRARPLRAGGLGTPARPR
jgi:hypothetical protein